MLSHILETKGLAAAYTAACEKLREKESHLNALWDSRFFQRRTLDNGTKKLWPVTEQFISGTYDLLDTDEAPEFFYCDEAGVLHPVTVAGHASYAATEEPESTCFVGLCGDACLVANGKVVGQVYYTDH